MTTCEQAREAAPELALGTLDGAERATLLRHLATCPSCRDEVAGLVEVADAIGLIAPPLLPSVGFEDRILAGMGIRPPAVSRRRRVFVRSAVLLAAAVIGAFLAIGGVAVLRNESTDSVASAKMIGGGGQTVGTAYVSPGHPPLVVVSVEYPFTGGVFRLQAIDRGGTVDTLGDLVAVDGGWRWSGLAKSSEVQSLRVVDADGNVTCEARLA